MRNRIRIGTLLLGCLALGLGACGLDESVTATPDCDNGSTSGSDCDVLCTTVLNVTGTFAPVGGPTVDDCGPFGTWTVEAAVDAASDECAAQGIAVPIEAAFTFDVREGVPPNEPEGATVIELVSPAMAEWGQQFSITESGGNTCNGKFAFYNEQDLVQHINLTPFLQPGATTLEGSGIYEFFREPQSF